MPVRMMCAAAVAAAALTTAACGGSGSDSSAAKPPAGCTPSYKVSGGQKGTLRVAAIQYPPYSEIKGGQPGGIDGEIVAGFAKAACLTLKTTETTFAAAVSSVTSNRADVAMGDIYRTKARAKEVGLTNAVYLDQIGIVSKSGLATIGDLAGKKVATVQGYYFVDAVKKAFGKNVHLFPDSIKMYQDVFAGRSDAGLDSYPAAVAYLKSRGKSEYQVKVPPTDSRVPATGRQAAQSAYLYDKSAQALGDGLNRYLEDIRRSGQLAQILSKYGIPASAAQVGEPRLS